MSEYVIFTDGSVDPKLRRGIGVSLLLPQSYLDKISGVVDPLALNALFIYYRFHETSSTHLEVQTVLSALNIFRTDVKPLEFSRVTIYTDSQCVAGLLSRRARLEKSQFISKRKNEILAHADLYRQFYELYDELAFTVIKVKGHTQEATQTTIDKIFSCVDQAARQALQTWVKGAS